MMTRWPSPAKLNLFLYITGQRADGYHTLQTLFQFLDYGDTLTIEPRTDGQLRLLTPVAGVPDEENLIVRAARLLMHAASESDRLPAGSGADISIDKRLPMGGGLGGGSSNAATVLVENGLDAGLRSDVASKPLFFAPRADIARLAGRFAIRDVLLVEADGHTWLSPAMQPRVQWLQRPQQVDVLTGFAAAPT